MIKINKLDITRLDYEDVWDEYIHYESKSSEYRFQMAEDEDFYLGMQLTKQQKDYLISVGQPPEANNKIRPAVEQVLANVASAHPEWDVYPSGKTNNKMAAIFNTILDKVWYDSNGDVHFRDICKDYIVKGLGYMYVYPDWNAEAGLGAMRAIRMSPEALFVDPNTILTDFSDATSIIYSDLHTKANLKIMFPHYADLIEDAKEDFKINELHSGRYSRDNITTRGDVTEARQPKVRKFVRWAKVSVPSVRITETQTGKTEKLTKKLYKIFTEDPNYKKLLKDGLITEKLVFETKIRETCVIGDQVTYDEVLPIKDYPIIPACNEHTGTPYPAGDVRHAKSPQRMLNRTEALLISHTNATTNFKLIVEDGAVEAKELQKWNIPNAIIRANPGALREGKIKEFSPPAISSALYQEKQRYELDIEQIFGAYKFVQGYVPDAPGTVGEAELADEAISRKQNWKVLPIYDMLTRAAKIMIDWIPHVYDKQRIITLRDKTGMEEQVNLNEPQINPETGAIEKIYNMKDSSITCRAVVGSTRAKSPHAELVRDLKLMDAGIYDRTEVIKNMQGDIDKQDLIQRHGEIGQLQSQNKALEDRIKALEGDLQTRERELFHTRMRAEVSEASKSVSGAVANIKATAKTEQARQRDATKSAKKDLDSGIKDVINSSKKAANQGRA